MADNTNNNQSQGSSLEKTNTFSKGMIKDIVDVYIPEGVWTNAINAINNAHNGEVGSIGNEQANLYCSTVPYTIVGIVYKVRTEWVIFSTNNVNSEIGIFDEADCSYTQLVNDECLNFKTYNLITGVCKENYDCTFSVYWQDNLNPDRVLNLDPTRIPYKCFPIVSQVVKNYYQYTITNQGANQNCGITRSLYNETSVPGASETQTYTIDLGILYGLVTLEWGTGAPNRPDRIQVFYDGVQVIDSGCIVSGNYTPGGGSSSTVIGPGGWVSVPAIFTFMKSSLTSTCTIIVTSNCNLSLQPARYYIFRLSCPNPSAPGVPPMPDITYIQYTDENDQVVYSPFLANGQSVTICALEGSVVVNPESGYIVSEPGALCSTKLVDGVIDPEACGAECCTTELDCDALRLHPFVQQPCVTVNKSAGSGQLNNGSYQAVIAYSENGVKLTDYSMPSNAQSLWDHTGMGGSIDIIIDNLDQNFEEYEVVVIATINQQTVAKKIGYYSINQTKVHLDQYNQSLPTVDLSIIPVKTVVYEKSEKMFDVGGYLIRTAVTTQPYFNYQPLANNIRLQWTAVEYPASYYWDGGNQTGYLRDEVYPFFIRWVYKTGARSASFHIPGRASTATDRVILPTSNPDVIDSSKRETWRVYDTSSRTSVTNELTPDGFPIIARGDMAYWESTERYPNAHPEIWGDLCSQPIRHHKMPSNETMHIHNNTGDRIYILGVQAYNIEHPVDELGAPIEDIVGYEILRGSREGNRSILAKGLFNNMIQYDIQGNPSVKGLFQNYPYNSLGNDPFLQYPGDPNNITVKNNIFSFHAPENNLVKPYAGSGGHIKIYTEEFGITKMFGEIPHRHPRFKFIHEDAFGIISVAATGMALLTLLGSSGQSTERVGLTRNYDTEVGLYGSGNSNLTWTSFGGTYFDNWTIEGNTDTTEMDPVDNYDSHSGTSISSGTGTAGSIFSSIVTQIQGLSNPGASWASYVSLILSIAAAIQTATLTFLETVDQYTTLLYNIIKFHDHVIQINSSGFYQSHSNVTNSNVTPGLLPSFTRRIENTKLRYVSSGLQDFDGTFRINNIDRNKYLALKLDSSTLPNPINVDNSKSLLPDTGRPFDVYEKNICSYYGAIKYDYENQYGQLYSIVQLPTNSCIFPASNTPNVRYNTGVIYGGDVYINRYTEKNPYFFFNTWLFDVPDGTEFKYLNYVNGPQPSYWLDSTRYDASLFEINISLGSPVPLPELDVTGPDNYYELHGKESIGFLLKTSFINAWMYLFANGVRDFFTESELNVAFRDYGEDVWEKFYDPVGNSFTDVSLMFRSDLIKRPVYYKYDLSLSASKIYSNFKSWGNILPRDYDPTIYATCFEHYPNKVVYSLQQQSGLKRDNWRNFLQFNYRDFEGKISTIKSLNAQGSLILFEDIEPMQFVGVDTFQSAAGVKYTVGDAGLFQQNMQSIVNADDAFAYGTSISNRGVVNTPYGLFWISQQTGKICSFNGSSINEISHDGMKHWFLKNLPSPLLEVYPDFPLYDNVLEGISCQAIFDSQFEILYFSKKDYKPTPGFLEIKDYLVYVEGEGFYLNETAYNEVPAIISCPVGYSYNTESLRCERLVQNDICPPGYTYNAESNMCEGDTDVAPVDCFNPCILDTEAATCSCVTYFDPIITPVLTPIDIKGLLQEVSWTISYDPKIKAWISFHDWHPEWIIPSYNHFLTVKREDTTTPVCPVGYTFDTVTQLCTKVVTSSQPADVTISQVQSTITPNPVACLLDIVIAMDVSGSTETGFRIEAQRQFVQDFLNSPAISSGMASGDIQVGFTRWSTNQISSMQPLGFSMSNTVTPAAVATYYSPASANGTNICSGFAGASAVLADRAGSELGDRSANPAFKSVMLFMTDATANNTGGDPSDCGTGSTAVGCVLQGLANAEVYSIFCDPSSSTLPGGASALLNAITCSVTANQFIVVADGTSPTNTTAFVANAVAGNICFAPPTCTCPEGYTLIGGCDPLNPGICKKVECACPEVCEPDTETTTVGECDDLVLAGTPGYINTDPLICNYEYTKTKLPSYTVSKLWRHNVRTDLFSNFYGFNFPWEIEYPVTTANTVTTLRNVEYTLDTYVYYNEGRDFNHILDENFDRAIIYNSEQISGLLLLNIKPKNQPLQLLNYPIPNAGGIDILYSKEENKFRFIQFYDITADRGEFTGSTIPMWITANDGYNKTINPLYVDYFKSPTQHKKIRHYGNKILLRKNVSSNKKMILKITSSKHLNSPR
jgi:hypothetical protein